MQKKINVLCVIADSYIPFFYELNDISPLPNSKKAACADFSVIWLTVV